MAEPKFKVGDLVTRGRGRVTLRVVEVRLYREPRDEVCGVVDLADERTRPRTLWINANNLRAKEAKS